MSCQNSQKCGADGWTEQWAGKITVRFFAQRGSAPVSHRCCAAVHQHLAGAEQRGGCGGQGDRDVAALYAPRGAHKGGDPASRDGGCPCRAQRVDAAKGHADAHARLGGWAPVRGGGREAQQGRSAGVLGGARQRIPTPGGNSAAPAHVTRLVRVAPTPFESEPTLTSMFLRAPANRPPLRQRGGAGPPVNGSHRRLCCAERRAALRTPCTAPQTGARLTCWRSSHIQR